MVNQIGTPDRKTDIRSSQRHKDFLMMNVMCVDILLESPAITEVQRFQAHFNPGIPWSGLALQIFIPSHLKKAVEE